MKFTIHIYFTEPIPELQDRKTGNALSILMNNIELEDPGTMIGKVNFWMQFGYQTIIPDQYGRKINIRISPHKIRTIKFFEPFQHEIELGEKVKADSRTEKR